MKVGIGNISIIFLLFVALAAGCVSQQTSQVTIFTTSDPKVIVTEIADEPLEWRMGLMNRPSLPENSGMLFVFPDEQPRSFWMKNTLIPLDIMFISTNLSIVDIATMQPCSADPCQSYISKSPAKYVLETNAGYVEKNNIIVGNKIAVDMNR